MIYHTTCSITKALGLWYNYNMPIGISIPKICEAKNLEKSLSIL